MNNNVEVQIVVPVHNEEKYIESCLISLIEQDYPKDKLLITVVNHNSTDNSLKIINKYCEKYNYINIVNKIGGTISSVRNFGAKDINSIYIGFLDGDCVVNKNWIKNSIDLLKEDEFFSCVGYKSCPSNDDDPWIAKTWSLLSSSSKYKGNCNVQWLSSFNLFLKREYYNKVGGFDEALVTCEDVDFGLKLSKNSSILFRTDLCVRHLGITKNIKEFYLKEFWRGKSSIKSFKKNNITISEIISLILPIIVLFSLFFNLSFLFINIKYFFFFLFFNFFILYFLTTLKLKNKKMNLFDKLKAIFVYLIYLIARSFSLLLNK